MIDRKKEEEKRRKESGLTHYTTYPCSVDVRLGELYADKDQDCEVYNGQRQCSGQIQEFEGEMMIKHPHYDIENEDFLHDIALVRLNKPAVYNSKCYS